MFSFDIVGYHSCGEQVEEPWCAVRSGTQKPFQVSNPQSQRSIQTESSSKPRGIFSQLFTKFCHVNIVLEKYFFQRSQFGAIEGDFALCMSLYHSYELLQQHGLRSTFNFLESLVSGEKGSSRTKAELTRNAVFKELFESLRTKFQPIQ